MFALLQSTELGPVVLIVGVMVLVSAVVCATVFMLYLGRTRFRQRIGRDLAASRATLEDAARRSVESDAWHQAIVEAAPVGLLVVDRERRIVSANATALAQFGYAREALVGLTVEALVPENRRAGHEQKVAGMFAQQNKRRLGATGGIHARRADGSLFPADIRLNPLPRIEGQSQQIAVSVIDLTERQQFESRFQAVYDNARDGICFVDQEFRVTHANATLRELLGLGDASGSFNLFDAFPGVQPDGRLSRDAAMENHARVLAEGGADFDWTFRHASGEPRPCRVSIVRLTFGSGITVFATMHDLRCAKAAEQALLEAKTRAEEAAAAKSRFLANMSHEFRTPMNAIIGFADLALRSDLSRQQREYIKNVHGAGASLLRIVDDILDFSKMEAGRLDLEHLRFDLDEVMAKLSLLTSHSASQKGLEYLFDLPADLPRRWVGDAARLTQVLVNLVSNAIKFTNVGEVRIACRVDAADASLLRFSVSDTGVGIEPGQMARLFDAFTLGDASESRSFGGTGLGLSIARQLVGLMGGDIAVQSRPGVGSNFEFTVRLESAGSNHPLSGFGRGYVKNARVLAVDDNENSRRLLVRTLREVGCRVDAANDGRQALALAYAADQAGDPYALVVSDWVMPTMNGVELTRALHNFGDPTRQPRVVLLTGHGPDEIAADATEAGVAAVLSKPVDARLLQRLVADLAVESITEASQLADERSWLDRLAGHRVMLVEDNELNRQIAVALLESVGMTIDVAENGWLALDQLLTAPPATYSAVLMDIQMPVMDGLMASRMIRAQPCHDELPIIALTAHAQPGAREQSLRAGMNAHLGKPIDSRQLFRTLAICIEAGQGAAPRPAATDGRAAEAAANVAAPGATGALPMEAALHDRLMHRFCRQHVETVAAIGQALASDRGRANRLAHELHADAICLGLADIGDCAARIDAMTASNAGTGAVQQVLRELATAVARVLAEDMGARMEEAMTS